MSQAFPETGDVVGEKYRLGRQLGRGGMGAVFEATHIVTGKRFAIKCQLPRPTSDASDVQRFLREARAASRVSHPNIVDIYDVGEMNGTLFLVMQYLDGSPLSALLGQGPLPIGPAVRTLISALRGVHAAHKKGVIHRDLKPDNIFLCRGHDGHVGEPKVLDFGVAKLQTGPESAVSASLTFSGSVMGTPYYMSPEQAEDSRSVDARTDVYACGVILYELLTGVRPFQATSLTALLLQVQKGDAPRVRSLRPAVPEKLEAIVERAMARLPGARFQDAGQLITALTPFASGNGLDARNSRPRDPASVALEETPLAVVSASRDPRRVPTRYVTLFGAGIALVLLLALAQRWLSGSHEQTPLEPSVHIVKPVVAPAAAAAPPARATAMPAGASAPANEAPSTAAAQPPAPAQSDRVSTKPAHKPVAHTATSAEPVAVEPAPAPQRPQPERTPTQSERGRLKVDLKADQF